ncbi:MAG: ABC transporter ATP-binding protein [Clostridiales bacterium]|nr:ABC transporter ATP-binding protein [Clostridiales bacterium]
MAFSENKGSVVIQTAGLTKRYGELTAVDHLNMEVCKGEIFGLLGPNGAGKTTTTLMLLGLTQPDEGVATINGLDCTRDPIEVKKTVGYLPDNVGFYGSMTGRENLRFMGRINGLEKEELENRIDGLLERVGLTEAADKKASAYSRGMRQRLGIADVLMKEPDIIIMDEPTLGIDPEGVRELMWLIRDLADSDGKTILLSSHQLYQVQRVCDRMGIFVQGQMVACGTLEELGQQINSSGVNTVELAAYPDNIKLLDILKEINGVMEIEKNSDLYIIRSSYDLRRALSKKLTERGYTIMHLRQAGSDLDEIYRKYFEKNGGKDGEDDREGKKRDKKLSRPQSAV